MAEITESTIVNELNKNGELWYTFHGTSMMPILREGETLIKVVTVTRPLEKYDVPLYRRSEGVYVLHRIMRVNDGSYDIRGDNTYHMERGIKDSQIVGVLAAFTRNGKTVTVDDPDYKRYVRIHCATYPLRWLMFQVRRTAGRCKRKLLGK